MNQPQNDPWQRRIGLGFLGLLFVYLYGKYLAGWAPSGGDLVNQYMPYQHLIREAIRHGEAPLWNAFTFCGRPLMADIQVGVLYPPNWLHWLLPLPLSFALLLALHGAWMIAGCWRLGRHWGLAPAAVALGTVLYCMNPFFTLKSYQGIVLFIYVGAWWPWLALATARLSERPGFGRMTVLTLALALSLLASSPQITFYGWLMVVALGLVLPWNPPGGAGRIFSRKIFWLAASFILALGLTAIQTAQTAAFIGSSFARGGQGAGWQYITDGSLSPRLLWLLVNPGFFGPGYSDRAFYWGSTMDYAESCSYAPLWVLLLLVPLAAFLFFGRRDPLTASSEPGGERSPRRRLAILGLVAMGLGVLLALGQYGPLFKMFYLLVPGFNRFRVPARLMTFFFTGEALLAALALDGLLRRRKEIAGLRLVIGLGAVAGLGLLWIPYLGRDGLWTSMGAPIYQNGMVTNAAIYRLMSAHALHLALLASAGVLLAAAALGLMTARPARPGDGTSGWVWLLPLLALAELAVVIFPFQHGELFFRLIKGVYGEALVSKMTPENMGCERLGAFDAHFYPETELIKALRCEHHGGRILWLDDVGYWDRDQNQPEVYLNRLVMKDLPDARGYDPVNARWIGVWMNLLAGRNPLDKPGGMMFLPAIARPAWLSLMGVESVLSYRDLSQTPGLVAAAKFPFPEGTLTVWRNTRFRGMAFAAPLGPTAADPSQAIALSAQLAANPALAPEETIVTDPAIATILPASQPLARKIDARFQVKALAAGANHFDFDVSYPQAALLCFAQSNYDGWMVRVDDQIQPLTHYCGTFLATAIPAGRHQVVFEFHPDGLLLGRMIGLIALVVLLYGLIRGRLIRKRMDEVDTVDEVNRNHQGGIL